MSVKSFLLKKSGLDFGLLILRICIGPMMLFGHGLSKLQNFDSSFHEFSDPLGLGSEVSYLFAVFSEVVCSIAITIGLFTRFTVLPLLITMLVAAFVIHLDDPWGRKEFALLYALPYLVLFFTGPGKYSLDNLLLKK